MFLGAWNKRSQTLRHDLCIFHSIVHQFFRVITGTVPRDFARDGSLRRVGHRTSWRGLFLDTCTFLKVKQSYTVSFDHKSLAHTPKLVKRQGIEHVRINKGHLLSSLCTDPPLSSVKIGAGASSTIFSEGRWGGGGGLYTGYYYLFPCKGTRIFA